MDFGLQSLIVKGARSHSKKQIRSLLQIGSLISGKQFGKGEVRSLSQIESIRMPPLLLGESFALASYVSEVVLRLCQPGDPAEDIFIHLDKCFAKSQLKQDWILLIRQLETILLEYLGVSIEFEYDHLGERVKEHLFYELKNNEAFSKADENCTQQVYKGSDLILIAQNQEVSSPSALRALKLVNRQLLAPHLGSRPLKSKQLWMQLQQVKTSSYLID